MPFLSILSPTDADAGPVAMGEALPNHRRSDARAPGHRLIFATLLAGLILVVAPNPAQAQLEERDGQARVHYENGVRLFDAGEYEGAFREFSAGHELSGRPKFLVSMAHAQRRRGLLHEAVRLYQQYLSLVSDSPLQAQVKRELRRLEATLDEQRRRAHPKRAYGLADAAEAEAEAAEEPAPRRARYASRRERADDEAFTDRRAQPRPRAATVPKVDVVEDVPLPPTPDRKSATVAVVTPVAAVAPPPPAALAKSVIAKDEIRVEVVLDVTQDEPVEPARRPYYKRAWFWVAVAAGVVATGAVAATQLVPRPADNGSKSQVIGTLGGSVE
ncbi:MAG TPA: hypothetical protein VGF45_16580 [Polyangia bacterium]